HPPHRPPHQQRPHPPIDAWRCVRGLPSRAVLAIRDRRAYHARLSTQRGPAMTQIASQLDPRSEDFQSNAGRMRQLVEDLDAQLERVAQGGGERAREKHLARGKLLPRERIQALLDPSSPFLELSALAAHG